MIDKRSRIIRILFAVVMLLGGVTLSLLAAGTSGTILVFAKGLGLGLIVTGCLSIFQEVVTSPSVTDESRRAIDRLTRALAKPGIRIVSAKRRGEPRYYKWVLENEAQDAFFAGHSILHRVDEDFRSRGILPCEEALRQKISEGSKIRILFLDPTCKLLDDVANAGGQEPRLLRRHLVKTLEICKRLRAILGDKTYPGELEIRTCRAIVQYAFHHVTCKSRGTDEMLIGFYFVGMPGTETPVFETDNEEIRKCFSVHFRSLFDTSSTSRRLLSYLGGCLEFDHEYFGQCVKAIAHELGDQAVERLRE